MPDKPIENHESLVSEVLRLDGTWRDEESDFEDRVQAKEQLALNANRLANEILRLRAELETEKRKVEVALPFLRQLSTANLTKGNCASFDVANKRIRSLANQALAALTPTERTEEEK